MSSATRDSVTPVRIGERIIGHDQPVYVIAEAGVNHNGDLTVAKRLIDVAAAAGADAVKFQTFNADSLASGDAPKADYQLRTTGDESQLEMLHSLELSADSFAELSAYCRKQRITFLSTPFDERSADLLDELGVPAFKIGSGEVTNWPFLAHVARKGKPIIFSTGMAYLYEVDQAVSVLREAGCDQLVLMHCVSNYPADSGDANLRSMATLSGAFGLPVGYSDHTLGIEVPLAAVALGACVVEKHFTLDRNLTGPDHAASANPGELRALVNGIRIVESAMGSGRKVMAASEANTRLVARRSLAARQNIAAGATLESAILITLRPGNGISPALLEHLIGRKTRRAIRRGELLSWSDLA